MCTIVALSGVRADYPLVLATNRDEFYARAASGPVRLLDQPPAVGGRDLVKSGTWMGVTREGLFVGVTNQRTLLPPDPSRRSRGELVMDALKLGERSAIERLLGSVDGREYNAFNLMWGDAQGLMVGYAREDRREIELAPVPKGVHVLPNDQLDSPDFFKVARAKDLLAPALQGDLEQLVTTLKATLADRARPSLEALASLPRPASMSLELLRELAALCVKTPHYGTRSSTIVLLKPGGVGKYLYADGAPDAAPFEDITGML